MTAEQRLREILDENKKARNAASRRIVSFNNAMLHADEETFDRVASELLEDAARGFEDRDGEVPGPASET